jgi:hypothetical protein
MKRLEGVTQVVSRALIGLLAAACGSSHGSGSQGMSQDGAAPASDAGAEASGSVDSGGTGEAQADAGEDGCQVFLHAYCAQFQACHTLLFDSFLYGTVDACVQAFTPACNAELTAPGTGATSATLASCGQALSPLDCGTAATTWPSQCFAAGSLANGATCQFSSQCRSTYCDLTSPSCGTCAVRVATGGNCLPADDLRVVSCKPGLLCTNGDTCEAPLASGASCQKGGGQCDPPLTCLQMGSNYVCAQPLAVGASPCDAFFDTCAGNAWCDVSSGTCEASTVLSVGTACDTLGDPCGAGEYCKPTDGGTTGVCAANLPVGSPCGGVDVCDPPAACENGVCQAYVGSSCP